MSIRVTAIRQSGGTQHEHIVRLWWTNEADGKTGDNSRAEIVAFIENNGTAYVTDSKGNTVNVHVVTPSTGSKYVQTYADGTWTNNLLALPRR